jgi:hypothetical protein
LTSLSATIETIPGWAANRLNRSAGTLAETALISHKSLTTWPPARSTASAAA